METPASISAGVALARSLWSVVDEESQAQHSVRGDEVQSTASLIEASLSASKTFARDWRLYVYEAVELAIFMVSACVCTVILFHSGYPTLRAIPSALVRRVFMGLGMGLTAVFIIHLPIGKRSGAHFNPAITLTYLRLKKIAVWDAVFYVIFQFAGGIAGVGVSYALLGKQLSAPGVDFAVTVPGVYGTAAAFAAEFFMAGLLMSVVLWTSNRPRFAPYTSYCVGVLISLYVVLFAPVSGFSINPARTVGSAVFAHTWTAVWVYFTAPLVGMLAAAEVYLQSFGADRILCAKLHPDAKYPCPFLCRFPLHKPIRPS